MSHKRRKWLDDLRQNNGEKSNNENRSCVQKKPKIEILSDILIKPSSSSINIQSNQTCINYSQDKTKPHIILHPVPTTPTKYDFTTNLNTGVNASNINQNFAKASIQSPLRETEKETQNKMIHIISNGNKTELGEDTSINKIANETLPSNMIDNTELDCSFWNKVVDSEPGCSFWTERPVGNNDNTDRKKTGSHQQPNNRRSRRKLDFTRYYIDFEDEEQDVLLQETYLSENSVDSTTYSSESESSTDKDSRKKRSEKKKKAFVKHVTTDDLNDTPIMKCKKKSSKRSKNNLSDKKKGKEHINTKGETVQAKKMRENPCINKNCGNKCGEISEERRMNLFKYFWDLNSSQRRKDWISQCASKHNIKRSETPNSKRTITYNYYINEGEERRRVCQKFLINTLDVTQRFILYTLETMVNGFAKEDERGMVAGGSNRTSDEVIEYAKQFIMSLPLLPSHRCRKDSKRLYLDENIKNVTNLHRLYAKYCRENNKDKYMSLKVFSKWFHTDLNVSFHKPKKDKCPVCHTEKNYDVKNQEETEKIEQHEREKNEASKRFIIHQNLHSSNRDIICASFDMQKVLCTPYGESITLYYSRKFAVYNFTVFETVTKNGFCYTWNEADARRGANEIATCLMDYIKNVDRRVYVKTLILYCDSCFGQNKNKTILAMLNWVLLSCENLETIQINYLIPGHTFMPVDSMHATIERSVTGSIVWAPSQWPTIFEFARKVPYQVTVLNGSDFNSYDTIVNKTFKKSLKLETSKLKIVTFKKKQPNRMQVKYSFSKMTTYTEIQLLNASGATLKTNVYPHVLPISQAKYNDLKKLVDKNIIPKRYSSEYLSFDFNGKVFDCLNDTDEEDT